MKIPHLLEEGQDYHYVQDKAAGLKLIYQKVRTKRGRTVEYFDYLTRSLNLFYALAIMAYKRSLMFGYKNTIISHLNNLNRLLNSNEIVAITIPPQEQSETTDRSDDFIYLVKYESLLFLETASPLKKLELRQIAQDELEIDNVYSFCEIAEKNVLSALEHFSQDSSQINNRFKSELAVFFISVLQSGELVTAVREAQTRLSENLFSLTSYRS